MIAPLQDYSIKGALWYQGESNASPKDAFAYRELFKNLIRSWRKQWGQEDLPFYWVQLANFENGSDSPDISPWAVLRESQSAALELPLTAQAVIIDIGAPFDIHPKNKHDVGYRLALAARHQIYGEPGLEYSGPVLESIRTDGSKAILTFSHITGGLMASVGGNAVSGFELAGADGEFHPANAGVIGDRIEVYTPSVDTPAAVRYAWAANPEEADLVNGIGLPASPFRADID